MRKLQLAGLLCLVLARGGLAQNSPAAFQLDQTMQRRYAAGDFNGTVLVARQGKVIYERAFGLANREWSVPNDLETKFEIGSMTKQFTAVLVLQFVSEGKLRLDGHVSEYLPYYRQDTGKRITISELLSHTSGLPSFTSIPGFLDGPASRVRYRGWMSRTKPAFPAKEKNVLDKSFYRSGVCICNLLVTSVMGIFRQQSV